ncbi:MAG: hypothetical protein ACOX81_05945 [Candidatus Heteroscillospira sp.]|jgi:hypothetical protein
MKKRLKWLVPALIVCLAAVGLHGIKAPDYGDEYAIARQKLDARLTAAFPARLPEGAELRYTPAFLQNGHTLELYFELAENELAAQKQRLDSASIWQGKPSAADEHGVFSMPMDQEWPEDAVVYVFFAEKQRPEDWNHSKRSYAVVSEEEMSAAYYAEG